MAVNGLLSPLMFLSWFWCECDVVSTHTLSLFCPGVTGLVQIDENGDRETDFALWDMTDTKSGNFQVSDFHTPQHFWRVFQGYVVIRSTYKCRLKLCSGGVIFHSNPDLIFK